MQCDKSQQDEPLMHEEVYLKILSLAFKYLKVYKEPHHTEPTQQHTIADESQE